MNSLTVGQKSCKIRIAESELKIKALHMRQFFD